MTIKLEGTTAVVTVSDWLGVDIAMVSTASGECFDRDAINDALRSKPNPAIAFNTLWVRRVRDQILDCGLNRRVAGIDPLNPAPLVEFHLANAHTTGEIDTTKIPPLYSITEVLTALVKASGVELTARYEAAKVIKAPLSLREGLK